MALSWLNLPCALKTAIGFGKQTLGRPASLPRPRGRSKALLRLREPIFKHPPDDPRRRPAGCGLDERLAQPSHGRTIGQKGSPAACACNRRRRYSRLKIARSPASCTVRTLASSLSINVSVRCNAALCSISRTPSLTAALGTSPLSAQALASTAPTSQAWSHHAASAPLGSRVERSRPSRVWAIALKSKECM